MGDSEGARGVRGAGSSLLGAVIAGGGTCAMTIAATSLEGDARGAGGQEQLILWVLLVLAAAGALLCLYLATVWALAAMIQLAGPAGRIGRVLLPALRVLAPRVARRVSVGAAVASAATGLVLGPALASEPVPGGAEDRPTVLQTSQLLPDEEPEPVPPAEPGTPLPSLGWGGEPSPAAEPTEDETPGDEPTEDEAEDEAPGDEPIEDEGVHDGDGSAPAPRSVVVRPGDTLWSITDDVLGPAPDDPALLAASWPLLHEANLDVIGEDPDMLRPGQVLTVPAGLDEGVAS